MRTSCRRIPGNAWRKDPARKASRVKTSPVAESWTDWTSPKCRDREACWRSRTDRRREAPASAKAHRKGLRRSHRPSIQRPLLSRSERRRARRKGRSEEEASQNRSKPRRGSRISIRRERPGHASAKACSRSAVSVPSGKEEPGRGQGTSPTKSSFEERTSSAWTNLRRFQNR